MDDIRKFWLENGLGETWDLTDNRTFATNPNGLGASSQLGMLKLGDTQASVSNSWNLSPIYFSLYFIPQDTNADVYRNYEQFFNFLVQRPLTLFYQTPNRIESYYRKVSLQEITKGEVDEDGLLICDVTLVPHQLWISSNENVIEVESKIEKGKSYELSREYVYASDALSNVSVYSKSSVEVPMIVEFHGLVKNPRFDVFDANNDKYGACKINGEYEYVYINSNDLEEEIALKENGSFVYNAISRQDMSVGVANRVYLTFIKLKPGQSHIEFEFDNMFSGYVVIRWRDYRVS